MSQHKEPRVFQLPENLGGGMTWDRYQEIAEAEAAGKPLELSDEERAEFEEGRDSLNETMGHFHQAFTGNFRSMFERLANITNDRPSSVPTVNVESMRQKAIDSVTQQARLVSEHSVVSQATLDSIAEAKRIEHDREERNSENIHVTAQVMQEMLAAMSDQATQAAARDVEAKSAARKNFWLALGSLIFAALAVAAPFVIEAIKGWD